jgi:hypothetical protein
VGVVFRVERHVPHQRANQGIRKDRTGSVNLVTVAWQPRMFRHQVEAEQEMCDRPRKDDSVEMGHPGEATSKSNRENQQGDPTFEGNLAHSARADEGEESRDDSARQNRAGDREAKLSDHQELTAYEEEIGERVSWEVVEESGRPGNLGIRV